MFQVKFYETYYFCNVIHNILRDQFSYIRRINDFYCDEQIFYLASPFQKYSAFHHFIEFVVEDIYLEEAFEADIEELKGNKRTHSAVRQHYSLDKLPIERAFDFHEIEYQSFVSHLLSYGKSLSSFDINDLDSYMEETRLSQSYEYLIRQTVKEIFHVLFQNRQLMLNFNEMLASGLELSMDEPVAEEAEIWFSKPGIIKRQSIPKWVQRAVYFRDRGRCVLCDKDLSGTVNLENHTNYDHIVPLAKHGFNDVSNIQLLCRECNQRKKDGNAITSNQYQSWYSYDEI
ncbi:HNH endonuclease [Vibrio metschnikovii]|uniref:HNH endonuclease n=1 Tax=bacterium 19MO03SA05 TaxID=2920620 RepID=A0AAU6VM49_UNCXX|nr:MULTISPECIES: HNH endonuclease signature motif containing protein [unclassified Vibrio]EKO3573771.1 HNH endonuclease [Vibrio metschnikovii]EKO3674713.1 HNH endonuclease [Vibrio metschnikovii]EKO3922473.1 HNH endonuclease [Vibrio metschnikovii]MDQ2110140.1 HNH endonuclease [Vibrio sp. 2017_1457_15]MDQ2162942.1 HNH endonuclease [Vibrio sp. 2017_1457_13]